MYSLKICGRFAASHVLPGHGGACSRLHGRTWQVTVRVGGKSLSGGGMLLDFHDLNECLARVLEDLDHRHLNDVPALAGGTPTAENLARHIFRAMAALLPPQVIVMEVEVGESPEAFASYREDEP